MSKVTTQHHATKLTVELTTTNRWSDGQIKSFESYLVEWHRTLMRRGVKTVYLMSAEQLTIDTPDPEREAAVALIREMLTEHDISPFEL